MRALVSSKVNQWTLLIATLPIVYSFGLGRPGDLPLDLRQQHELLLTAAQSVFALVLIANLFIGRLEGVALFGLFAIQLVFPNDEIRTIITILYLVLTFAMLVLSPSTRRGVFELPRIFWDVVVRPSAKPSHGPAPGAHEAANR